MPIRVLDPQVISRIAAGEVVERPASVVKELVENSLDAGATQVSVEVRGEGGVNQLRVIDNGSGIPSDEVELAFARYTTSKIASLDDLGSLLSLGFRGEALFSIAAVAEVDIVTCTADEVIGSYLSLKGGEVINRGSQGRSPGTTVTVSHLFRRVPARLKFLKSPTTENSHIANVVSRYALAFPEVRFRLSIDGRETLRTPGSGRLLDTMAKVYGLELAQNMLEIKSQGGKGGVLPMVTGMIGSPVINRSNRDYISLLVNRRWVGNRRLVWAVEQAYHGLLGVGKHPVAVVNVSLSPQEVDVNIHPTKAEVKFRDEGAVFSLVQRAVRNTLVELTPVPEISKLATTYRIAEPGRGISTATYLSPSLPLAQTPAASLPVLRIIGQFRSSYIIAEGPDGLYLIDQHAAHERIRFEQIKEQRLHRQVEVQGLLEPVTIEASPQQKERLRTRLDNLAEFGFVIEPFGEKTFLVRTVPALLAARDWRAMLRELLDSAEGKEDWEERIMMLIACHSAIRAGQLLSDSEMDELVRQLEQVAIPNTCPHGRPTIIRFGLGQLNREFGRT
ncbi:MAG: DNA mismatch repair endonuclease MutL [Dehalococcoidales bacterium]|nr:DNA mismatch repair endonuclease MutL [Dehalococcoidales bacterium]